MPFLDEIILSSSSVPVPQQIENLPFGDGFWPWMQVARERICKRCTKELENLLPEAIFSMEESLVKRWVQVAAPSFALEMSIKKLQGELEGETPYDRYQNFLQNTFWNAKGLRAFFAEYKQVAYMVENFFELWEEQTVEFLQRLAEDLPLLVQTFNGGESLGRVVFLKQNEGDFHQGGRSVHYLKFESGKELFYKPKNLLFAATFHSLLKELDERGLPLGLKGYTILPCEGYGWEEKVHHLPCENVGEVSDYFERAGILLCLLHLLNGSDVHYENLIASGAYPILIDQETFFHSMLAHPDKQETMEIFGHSVLKTALLPIFIEKEGKRGPDISGLTGEGAFFSVLKWQNIRTDEMKKGKEEIFEEPLQHRVIFKGTPQDAHKYVDEIVLGFRKMYAFVQEHREIFIKKEGWIDRLATFPVRMLTRATRLYAYLLERLSSPPVMLHEEEREKELDILYKTVLGPGLEYLTFFIEEEKRAIIQGDIPFFHTLPKKQHLYAGKHFVLENCLDGTAYTRVMKRIIEMDEEECEKQEVFIRKAFYAKQAEFHKEKEGIEKPKLSISSPCKNEEEILIEVRHIADVFLDHAYRSRDGSLGWIHLEPNPQFNTFNLEPMSGNLYGGKIGIALFFSALFALTQEGKWKEEALNTLKNIRTQIAKGASNQLIRVCGIGGMSGVGSMIYGFSKIASLLHEPSLLEEASILALHIEERDLENDKMYDIIGGSAGLILSLLALWEKTSEKRIMDLAIRVGEHLCSKAEATEHKGVGWKNRDGLYLLGFSHGIAGISYALLKLAAVAKKSEFSDVAQRALVYERMLFCPKRKNWPRLGLQHIACFSVQWCHGAVGIGLGRLASLAYLKDDHLLEEIAVALMQTKENLFSEGKLGLCCGMSGKLEFLRSANHLFPDESVGSIKFSLLAHYKNQPREYFDLSFMQGAAGIGYTLLRTLDQKNLLPQILLMQ